MRPVGDAAGLAEDLDAAEASGVDELDDLVAAREVLLEAGFRLRWWRGRIGDAEVGEELGLRDEADGLKPRRLAGAADRREVDVARDVLAADAGVGVV